MIFFRTLLKGYRSVFAISEIEQSPILQWLFGALLFFFFLVFQYLIGSAVATVETANTGTATCWPYFQDCWKLYFLHSGAVDNSRGIWYMALYGIILVIVWCMWRKRWTAAHALLFILLLWEALVFFVFTYSVNAPYYYYHIFLTLILLVAHHKEFFLKVAFVLFYFLSATIKFDEAWVLGTYFTTLKTGLPLFPDLLTPLFTNIVIFSQVVGCWLLLSGNRVLQRAALAFFVFFHLYSGIFVQYMYPSIALPPLLILFGPLYRHTPIPVARSTIVGWTILLAIALFQASGFIVPERRITLEGNRFGMFMFETNHQCRIVARTYSNATSTGILFSRSPGAACTDLYCSVSVRSTSLPEGGSVQTEEWESGSSLYRCDPFEWWTRYHAKCESGIDRIALTIDHSINGGPFYRIVNLKDVCEVSYRPFQRNEWIKVPPDAPAVGYPTQNIYHY